MSRDPIPTWYFALVVARRGDRFLRVHERKHGQRWYLPAGRVEHSPTPEGTARCRVFFTAHPVDDTPPLSAPNEHSLEARWVTLADLDGLELRHPEVREVLAYVAGGGVVSPLSVLVHEGAPWGGA